MYWDTNHRSEIQIWTVWGLRCRGTMNGLSSPMSRRPIMSTGSTISWRNGPNSGLAMATGPYLT